MPLRIEDYAIIGDCETAALVGKDGSLDWLCWPRFDSGACFAALLGSPDNGRWSIACTSPGARSTRRYRPDTLVLETRFETDTGTATLTEFMPPRGGHSHVVRLLTAERGSVSFKTELVIRFGYGEVVPWVTRCEHGRLRAIAGPDKLMLQSSIPLHGENMKTVGEFKIGKGETASFALTYAPSHLPDPPPVDLSRLLRQTEKFWRDWTAGCKIEGRWSETVKRSLITLKALTHAQTGGLVAAATTSLPEQIGGTRNWDYRFCWLRDATLTLLAFMNTGYYEEARAWRAWLIRAVAGTPNQLQIMYGLAGERRLTEYEIDWLPGYERSAPVRIGNAAHEQLQLDVYGELFDALYQARKGGIPADENARAIGLAVLQDLEKRWREPDNGIWEVRSEPLHFTHSKVMAWVAFDRAIKSVDAFGLEGPVDHWRTIRQEIHDEVCRHGFDSELNSFVRSYGSKELDASLLMLPAVGFLHADDPRIRGTVAAIEKRLVVNGFVRRYDTAQSDDGLPAGEGVFIACGFWLVDAYVMLGRRDDAERLFDRLVGLQNDLGLLSEEYDPKAGRMVGNFPQAFSHLALVNSACNLSRMEKPAEQRAEHRAKSDAKSDTKPSETTPS
ncbi:glycoside hydrolase family 15 protein [Rhodoplanes sp. Z2-YC6860]|uniref:glycoside hydrolase family 15 protein n=1 Tax=Rhodoplanes sp. Z2-YC6860 TaxID=674703 RepID=UPI00078CE81E|nr:glycoside hydrolase family 15 protein [Rhodoplanes sp. Z2-YC6860]AMN45163.1 glycoside hydrolase family protein [Rhodoplanes sp. Z2-YC6860]